MTARRVRALSCHARYACGNSGACCTAGWPIPVETATLPVLRHAIDTGRVTPAAAGPLLTFPADRPASTGAVLGRTAEGACVFFDRVERDGCCRVQRHAGMPAMPIACRQFPRIARHDARGTDVALSHWCPTALACLDTDAPVTIVHLTAADVDGAALDGLDARDTWPPLLRPDCLWDLDAFEAFEAHAVDLLANGRMPLHARTATLADWAERLRCWGPGDGALRDLVIATAPPVDGSSLPWGEWCPDAGAEAWDTLVGAIPADLRNRVPVGMHDARPADAALLHGPETRGRVGRYLAARLFGSWVAYQGHGVRALVASTAAALTAVVRGLAVQPEAPLDARVGTAIRSADLLLVHLATPELLAAHYDACEHRAAARNRRVTGASAAGASAAGVSWTGPAGAGAGAAGTASSRAGAALPPGPAGAC